MLIEDLKRFGLAYDEVACETMSKESLRKKLRKTAAKLAFEDLYTSMQRSTKVRSMRYCELAVQPYLLSDMNEEEKNMLTAIRSKCLRNIKTNFQNMHRTCLHCPLLCNNENPHQDTQEHLLQCSVLGESNLDFDFIHASVVDQEKIAKEMCRRIEMRTTLLEAADSTEGSCCLLGAWTSLDLV